MYVLPWIIYIFLSERKQIYDLKCIVIFTTMYRNILNNARRFRMFFFLFNFISLRFLLKIFDIFHRLNRCHHIFKSFNSSLGGNIFFVCELLHLTKVLKKKRDVCSRFIPKLKTYNTMEIVIFEHLFISLFLPI